MVRYLQSIRISNLLLLSLLFWGLMLNYLPTIHLFLKDHLLLFFSILTTTSSGYLINNFFDKESDHVNDKEQLVQFSSKFYLSNYFIHLIISFILLLVSNLSGNWFFLVLCCHLMTLLYSWKLQHFPLIGNLTVAILCCLVVITPIFLAKKMPFIESLNIENELCGIFILFCFLLTICREIIKDIEDIKGDQKVNSNTLPIITNLVISKSIALIIALGALFLLAIVCINSNISIQSLLLLVFSGIPLTIFILKTYPLKEPQFFKGPSNWIKITFLSASLWLYVNLLL